MTKFQACEIYYQKSDNHKLNVKSNSDKFSQEDVCRDKYEDLTK